MEPRIKKTKSCKIERFTSKIWKEFFSGKGIIPEEGLLVYLIYSGNKKIGYFEIFLMGKVAYLREFIIKNDVRGKGIGRKVLEKIIAVSRKKGCRKIRLETNKELMPEAYRLYESFGFREEALLKNDYFNKDWVILSKRIDDNKIEVNKNTKK